MCDARLKLKKPFKVVKLKGVTRKNEREQYLLDRCSI